MEVSIIKGFALNEQGDVIIASGAIQMVQGSELTKQTIKSVLGTQKGEWFLNWEEGIDHYAILGKKHYASQSSSLDKRYMAEIDELKRDKAENEAEENALNELLAKRLDGEL